MPVTAAHHPPRTVHRPKTWMAADLEAGPERVWPRFEVIDGVLYCDGQPADALDEMAPAPLLILHQQPLQRLAFRLQSWLDDYPDWMLVLSPADLRLSPGRMVQPDLFVIRREDYEAYAALPEPRPNLSAVPDLVVEVLSKRTASYDRNEKRRLYESAGVPEYWIVDARTRIAEQYVLGSLLRTRPAPRLMHRSGGGRYGDPEVADEGQRVLSVVLEAEGESFGLDVAELFRR